MPNHNSSGFSAYFINVHRDAELGERGHWSTCLDNSYSAGGIRFEICLVHYRCLLYGFSFLIDKSSTNDLEKWKYLKRTALLSLVLFCLPQKRINPRHLRTLLMLGWKGEPRGGRWAALTDQPAPLTAGSPCCCCPGAVAAQQRNKERKSQPRSQEDARL